MSDTLDPAVEALARQASLDAEFWFTNFAKIKTKEGVILDAPKPNYLQELVFAHYRKCQLAQLACLIMILKPRQKGASTIAEGVLYQHMRRYANLNGLIMGDVAATSAKVFKMFQRYAQLDLYPWNDGVPNILDGGDLTEVCTLGNGSVFSQETAGSTNAGRSGTVQCLHLDEVAFFQKAANKDPTTAVLGSFYKESPKSLGFATSTANGASGWFYNTWNAKNDWFKIFAAWFQFEDSSKKFRSPDDLAHFKETMTEDERLEQQLYKVSMEQLNWRRNTINTDYEGDVARFRQEMPSNDQECFMLSSSPRFDMGAIKNMKAEADTNNKDRTRGNLVIQTPRFATWMPDEKGDVIMFEPPRVGCRYLVSLDTCSGEDQTVSGMSADRDWHAAQVWRQGYTDDGGNWRRPKLVARHKSQADTDVLAEVAASMSVYYGMCLVIPEVNGMAGIHIVKQLLKYRVPVFRRKAHTTARKQLSEEEKLEAYGWMTDKLTRKWIIDHLAPLIRKEELDIPDAEVLAQLGYFVLTEKGSAEALPGKHDDEVLAAAIAVYNLGSATEYKLNTNRLISNPADSREWRSA